jgi:Na+-driven multidrug efflux pump
VLVTSAALCAAMYLGKSALAAALTNSRDVQEQLKQVLPLVVATIICECGQGLLLAFCTAASGS